MNRVQTQGQGCSAATLNSQSSSSFSGGFSALPALFFAGLGLFATWYDRWDQRRNLAQLDERLLRDIGLDRHRAAQEARKPFWMG